MSVLKRYCQPSGKPDTRSVSYIANMVLSGEMDEYGSNLSDTYKAKANAMFAEQARSLSRSQESSRLSPQDAAAEEVPGPEQLIKLSMTIGYAGCRPTSCSHASHSRAHTAAPAHTGPASAQRPCTRTDIHALALQGRWAFAVERPAARRRRRA